MGYGTRGGTSRGEGSGSRYLKVICPYPGCGYQVRITRKWLALGAPLCPAGHGSMELERSAVLVMDRPLPGDDLPTPRWDDYVMPS